MADALQTQAADGRAWYAARTYSGQELVVKRRLSSAGIEHFIPVRKVRNSRGKFKDHPVISCLVFIRATKQCACELRAVDRMPVFYLFDYARHTMLTVPDKQMDDFRRVLEADIEEGGLVDKPVAIGERVRVTEGPLKGVEGNVLELQGRLYLVVGLMNCLFARARVPRAWLEKC